MSDEIFREVDEEVKRERWLALWNQYGWYMVGLIVFVIASTEAVKGWQSYREARQADLSQRFHIAAQEAAGGDMQGAVAGLEELAEAGNGGYAMIARFRHAALMTENGDPAAAVALYRAIADNDAFEDLYRDLAVLMMAMNSLAAAPVDGGDIQTRLAALSDGANPFRHSARELAAALALTRGDKGSAVGLLKSLTDDTETPLGIRRRAAVLLQAIEDPATEDPK